MVRVHHRLNFPTIVQPSFDWPLIKLTSQQECHKLIHRSSNCRIYCYKFKRLIFITLTMMSTRLNLACNNFIFCGPMPRRPKLITRLIICLC